MLFSRITNKMQPCNRIHRSSNAQHVSSGVPLETCWAFDERWILWQGCILLVISTESHCDARIH